jgi:hypothetical protein
MNAERRTLKGRSPLRVLRSAFFVQRFFLLWSMLGGSM